MDIWTNDHLVFHIRKIPNKILRPILSQDDALLHIPFADTFEINDDGHEKHALKV